MLCKVTAFLGSPIAVFDDHSPCLDALLQWLILDAAGLASPNPTEAELSANQDYLNAHTPLDQGTLGDYWYWQTSGPCYSYQSEQVYQYRKRWDPGEGSPSPDWGKRKAKWNTSAGGEKSYDLPLYLRDPARIDWYCNGDPALIEAALEGCAGLGKKRGHGHGQVIKWEVCEADDDYHLWRNGILMRPVPVGTVDRVADFAIREWGWKPPYWTPLNRLRCAMPVHTVIRVGGDSLARNGR